MKYGLLIALITLTISAPSIGEEFGAEDEVVEAARLNQEPAYIQELMEAFGDKLASLVVPTRTKPLPTLDLSSPRNREAFLLTMVSILRISESARPAPRAAALYRAQAAAQAAARAAARGVLGPTIAWNDRDDASVDASNAAWEAAEAATRDGLSTEAVDRIYYRVVEWKELNFIFGDCAWLIPKVYKAALSQLRKRGGSSSVFMSEAAWLAFRKKHFSNLKNAQIFVDPWLAVFDSVMYEKATLSFLLGKHDRNSKVYDLPEAAFRLVSSYVVPLYVKRRP